MPMQPSVHARSYFKGLSILFHTHKKSSEKSANYPHFTDERILIQLTLFQAPSLGTDI